MNQRRGASVIAQNDRETPSDTRARLALAALLLVVGLGLIAYYAIAPLPSSMTGTIQGIGRAEYSPRGKPHYTYIVAHVVNANERESLVSSTSKFDIGQEVRLTIDSATGTAQLDGALGPKGMTVGGLAIMAVGLALLAHHIRLTRRLSSEPLGLDGLDIGLESAPYLSERDLGALFKQGVNTVLKNHYQRLQALGFVLLCSVLGLGVGNELFYRSYGPTVEVSIISAQILGAKEGVLIIVELDGQERETTTSFLDYSDNPNSSVVFPDTNPLKTRSARNQVTGRASLLYLAVGATSGLCLLVLRSMIRRR